MWAFDEVGSVRDLKAANLVIEKLALTKQVGLSMSVRCSGRHS